MSSVVMVRRWRLRLHTRVVLASIVVVTLALALSPVLPMVLTTVAALVGGTAFVLGVSASISAFLERESYADSDFWR